MNFPIKPGTGERHPCPGGCGRTNIPAHMFACRACWFRLPGRLRTPIWVAYTMRNWEAHWEAMADAMDWYAENEGSK